MIVPDWPYADRPQFKPADIKMFRGREWVPLELAEAKLQWWQSRDWTSAHWIQSLEKIMADVRERLS